MDNSLLNKQRDFARKVLAVEAKAISNIELASSFDSAVDLLLENIDPKKTGANGNLVLCGLGKSGLIARKLAATFTSTGTPAHFLHPTEAMHGDLGRVRQGDVVLMLSFSGNTQELVALASILRQDGVKIIAIVSKKNSDLGRLATCVIEIGEIEEACPLQLAPTASTTAMLALGDCLALTTANRRSFSASDFKKFHPGGGLGKQLTSVVKAMRFKAGKNLPLIEFSATLSDAYNQARKLSKTSGLRRAGALLVVDDNGKLAGIFTDGDLRRLVFDNPDEGFLNIPINKVMTKNPRHLDEKALVRDAVQIIRESRLDELPIVDTKQRPLGLIDVQDLVALKVIEN